MNLNIPLNNLEAEQSVLGSILIDQDCLYEINSLHGDDFYNPSNKRIFEIILSLQKRNSKIDLITVKTELENSKVLNEVGGMTYLMELTEIVPTTSNFSQYVQIVKNCSYLRNFQRISNVLQKLSTDGRNTPEIISEELEKELGTFQFGEHENVKYISDVLQNSYERMSDIIENGVRNDPSRISIGYSNFENKLGGLKKGELIILAARPSMGKTAFSLNLAKNISHKNHGVLFVSMEMSEEQLANRFIAMESEIDMSMLNNGRITADMYDKMTQATDVLHSLPLKIMDDFSANISKIKREVRKMKREKGVDCVIVDYLQLISNGSQNRLQEISEISRGLKGIARELDVVVIALSQLSREVEKRPDKRPIMSDLRESGSIEQDADKIIMMYREEYYDEFTEKKGITDLIIRKNRQGKTGTHEFNFNGRNQKFLEIESAYKNQFEH